MSVAVVIETCIFFLFLFVAVPIHNDDGGGLTGDAYR